jgi:dolichol-phosphate mannosyltransferase
LIRGSIQSQHRYSNITIVVSAYNEQDNVETLWSRLTEQLQTIKAVESYEIVFVDDGSVDETFAKLASLQSKDHRVKVVKLSRNFGHEVAMTAGMDFATGDCVLFMDADLQHPPSLVPRMIERWREGNDIVLTRRKDSGGKGGLRKLFYQWAYWFINMLQDENIPNSSPDFRLIDRCYVDALKDMDEKDRMLRGLLSWAVRGDYVFVDFEPDERLSGESKYSIGSLFRLGVDGIISFTDKPLKISLYLGGFALMFSSVLAIFTIWHHFAVDDTRTGYATILVSTLFLSSVQFLVLGILGLYIGKIHFEVKKRPLYVAKYFGSDE